MPADTLHVLTPEQRTDWYRPDERVVSTSKASGWLCVRVTTRPPKAERSETT
jgi:hypothetical protein